MKVVAIIQARMGSTRLPKKVLMELAGRPILWHMLDRLNKSKEIDQLVIATSKKPQDDEIETFCNDVGVPCYRGSENNVLSRYYFAAKQFGAHTVVRFTGDCPLIDPRVSDNVIKTHLDSFSDYTSNVLVRTFPRGLDTEVFSFKTLEKTYHESTMESDREHVTLYIRNNQSKFKVKNVEAVGEIRRPDIRLTVDTIKDYIFIREIFHHLYVPGDIFYTNEIIRLLNKYPELMEINKNVKQKEPTYNS